MGGVLYGIKTVKKNLFFSSWNYSSAIKWLTSSLQLVTEGPCLMDEVAWQVHGGNLIRGNESPFWWQIADLITRMYCIFGYVVIFMLSITLTTWRFIFLENLSRVNFMAVTQVEPGVFPHLLSPAFSSLWFNLAEWCLSPNLKIFLSSRWLYISYTPGCLEWWIIILTGDKREQARPL